MKRIFKNLFPLVALCISAASIAAQPETPATAQASMTTMAVAYPVDDGSTKVDLVATHLIPEAKGEAKVEAKMGATTVEVDIDKLKQPGALGTEFLTYVLWAISPDGRTVNLGELRIDEDGDGELKVTTQLQTFALIVTSEPYYSVRQPSELVVLTNQPRKDTKGALFAVSDMKLMNRTEYERGSNPLALTLDTENVPLEMYEARNAVDIARAKGAEIYAPEVFAKANDNLLVAESLLQREADKKEIISIARQTVQFSEDARAISATKQEQALIVSDRNAAAAAARTEAEARAAAEVAAANARADAEVQRQAAIAAANEERLRAQARADTDAARAREAAVRADADRAKQAVEAERLSLHTQLGQVMITKDTARGLVVNISDVLFETGKHNLNAKARERLSRLSGILAARPDLQLEVEGHTDNTGGRELNQSLSENRARAVANFLIEQGVPAQNISVKGVGEADPIADNSTAWGRKKNRRVEVVVSGESIGRSSPSSN